MLNNCMDCWLDGKRVVPGTLFEGDEYVCVPHARKRGMSEEEIAGAMANEATRRAAAATPKARTAPSIPDEPMPDLEITAKTEVTEAVNTQREEISIAMKTCGFEGCKEQTDHPSGMCKRCRNRKYQRVYWAMTHGGVAAPAKVKAAKSAPGPKVATVKSSADTTPQTAADRAQRAATLPVVTPIEATPTATIQVNEAALNRFWVTLSLAEKAQLFERQMLAAL